MLPVLLIVAVPPLISFRPVTDKVVAVFVRLMLPLVVLVALNPPTVLAPLSVWPVAEVVVRVPVVLNLPAPDSVIVLAATAVTLPEALLTVPAMVMPPVEAPVAVSVTEFVPGAVMEAVLA